MVSCPECGEPLVKRGNKSKYYCENENCSVIFVRRPYEPHRMRIFFAALMKERQISGLSCVAARHT